MSWFGYRGRVLHVDLSRRTHTVEELSLEEARRFVGGSGLNAWLLYERFTPGLTPLSPENPLIFGAGPLVGTSFPSSSRSTFTTLSPLTGLFGDANGGGFFGAAVKQSGFDHIVVTGAAETPCCLVLGGEGRCTIEDAPDLWGLDTVEVQAQLGARYPGSEVACIGPAGENRVAYASITTNRTANSWARTGVGAVMGSKRLKAIVAMGGAPVPAKTPEAFDALSDRVRQWAVSSPTGRLFSKVGTAIHIDLFPAMGLFYKNNGERPITLGEASRIDWTTFRRSTEFTRHGCHNCPLKCGKRYRLNSGSHCGEEGHRYDLTTAFAMGFNVGIDDLGTLLHLANECNRLGLDLIEFSGVASMAIDASRQGIIAGSSADGLKLDWGAGEALAVLARRIAAREGLGGVLAEGSRRAAAAIGGGAEKLAMHMKGMCEAGPSCPPLVLGYAVASRGGDHMKAGIPILCLRPDNLELAQKTFGGTRGSVDLHSHEDKGRVVWWHENYKMAVDCLGICLYLSSTLLPLHRMLPDDLAEAYRTATGMEMDGEGILAAGARGYHVEKAINARLGVDRLQDTFPTRPEAESWSKGIDLDHPGMLEEYYRYRGCSEEGLPIRERLEELDLGQVADDLADEGRLGAAPCGGKYQSFRGTEGVVSGVEGEGTGGGNRPPRKSLGMRMMSLPGGVELLTKPLVLNLVMHGIDARRKLRDWLRSESPAPPEDPGTGRP